MKLGIDINSGERPFQELLEGVLFSSKKYKDSLFYIIGNIEKVRESFPEIDVKALLLFLGTSQLQ